MKVARYFKIHCPACGGGIEFPAYGVGDKVSCPHCQQLVVLDFGNVNESSPTEQIEAYLEATSFPKTRAELSFLKLFQFPTELSELRGSEIWQTAMGATPQSVVSRYTALGMLQDGSWEIATLLQSKSKDELRALARDRALATSGTKEVLANRLFKADPAAMSEFFRDKVYFVCTTKGRLIVERFMQFEAEIALEAERTAELAIRSGRNRDACLIVATFEASKVFQRGVGIDWKRYDPTRDLAILEEIATHESKRHLSLSSDVLLSVRTSAAMMQLWGTSNARKWLAEGEREFATEAHFLWSAGIARTRLNEFRQAGIQEVEVLSTGRDDLCAVCRRVDKKTFPIASAPELPHEDCTCEYGCGCLLCVAH